MKGLLFATATALAFASMVVRAGPSPDDLDQWTAHYYLDPKPDGVDAALRAITAKGFFENDDVQAPLSGFFTEVFRANPDRIEGWITPYIGVARRHILYSALWMANSKSSRAALERLANGATPDEARSLRSLLTTPPPTIESMAIDSPAALDYLWGCFLASGSDVPVLRIIDQLKLADVRGNLNAMMIGGAAQWSLSSNARQHDKVLSIVKVRMSTADRDTKAKLQEILSGIETERAKK
jgi:hypothetical protein